MLHPRRFVVVLLGLAGGACGGADNAPSGASSDSTQQGWDSAGGNPTHATHSYLTEEAISRVRDANPEVETYRADLLKGANEEIHDLVLSDVLLESLRLEFGGTNGSCEHPERVWAHAQERYAAGDVHNAYWYLGILLHYVEDLGVPAHALGVYHQSGPTNWDTFELLAFSNWVPSYDAIDREDPGLADPSAYTQVSREWTASNFGETWPGTTYTRTFFDKTWLFSTDTERTFLRNREGRTGIATSWALASAASHWSN
jgi:hypothetical protein